MLFVQTHRVIILFNIFKMSHFHDYIIGCLCVSVLMLSCFAPHRLDSEMPEGVERMNSTLLFLRPLQRNDTGVYRCEVANDINLRSRDVRILIQGERTRTQLTPVVSPSLWKHCACMHVIEGIDVCDIVLQAEM